MTLQQKQKALSIADNPARIKFWLFAMLKRRFRSKGKMIWSETNTKNVMFKKIGKYWPYFNDADFQKNYPYFLMRINWQIPIENT